MTNYLREPEFDSWVEQFSVRLYIPPNSTLSYSILKELEGKKKNTYTKSTKEKLILMCN